MRRQQQQQQQQGWAQAVSSLQRHHGVLVAALTHFI
jgi:hypothetical protein